MTLAQAIIRLYETQCEGRPTVVRSSSEYPAITGVKAAILDAVIRVVARDGFDVVSVRTVAQEAGLAAGTVQYHFRSRDDLLREAIVRLGQRQLARIEALPKEGSIATRLIRALSELIPLDDARREEGALWVAISSAASTRAPLADQHLAEIDLMRTRIQTLLQTSANEGFLRPGISPTLGADMITALTNGLTIDGINAPATERARLGEALSVGIRLLVDESDTDTRKA